MQVAQNLELRETPTSTVFLPIVYKLGAGVSCSFADTEDPPCWPADPLGAHWVLLSYMCLLSATTAVVTGRCV